MMSRLLVTLIASSLMLLAQYDGASPAFAAPKVLTNFVGFETGGTDEAIGIAGTPVFVTSPVRSGDFALEIEDGDQEYQLAMSTGGGNNPTDDGIIGFGLWFDSPSSSHTILRAIDDTGGQLWRLDLNGSGQITAFDSGGTSIGTTVAIGQGSWSFIEIRWQHLDSADFNLHVNGNSEISSSSDDLSLGNLLTEDIAHYVLERDGVAALDIYFDDTYAFRGANTVGDFLGNAEVFRYQANTNSATPDASCDGGTVSLSQGVWQDLGETPLSIDATEPGYTGAAEGGSIDTDDSQSGNNFRPGPSGDGNIDGTIVGGKWLHRLRRSNGSATTHRKCFGNTGDGTTGVIITTTNSFLNFLTVTESVTEVPTGSEHARMGFAKRTGSRSIFAEEMWGFVLHVPDHASYGGVY